MAYYISNVEYEDTVNDLIITEVAHSPQPYLRIVSGYISPFLMSKLATFRYRVVVICAHPSCSPTNQQTLDLLAADPKYDLFIYPKRNFGGPSLLHSKFILGYAGAIVGSANFTYSGIDKDAPRNVESGVYFTYPEDIREIHKIHADYNKILADSEKYPLA